MAASGNAVNRFQDDEYKNFLKIGRALKCTGTGLAEFCTNTIDNFHRSLSHGTCQNPNINTRKKIKQVNGQWTIDCHCGVCELWLRSIEQAAQPYAKLSWANTDAREWAAHPWQLAKVYMGPGKDRTNHDPADTDTAGLLQLIINCKQFNINRSIKKKVEKVIKLRNELMHSAEFRITSAELTTKLDAMRDLLQVPILQASPTAQTAVANINDIESITLDINDRDVILQERDMWKEMVADQSNNTEKLVTVIQSNEDLNQRLEGCVLTVNESLKRFEELLVQRYENEESKAEEMRERRHVSNKEREHTRETPHRQLSSTVLLDDRFILQVAKETGSEFYAVCIDLGFSQRLIDTIEYKAQRDIERVMIVILTKWRNNSPLRNDNVAMINQLCQVFRNNSRNDLADDIYRGQLGRRDDYTQHNLRAYDTMQYSTEVLYSAGGRGLAGMAVPSERPPGGEGWNEDESSSLKQLVEGGDEDETALKQGTRHIGQLSEGLGDNDTPLKEVAGDTRRLTGRRVVVDTSLKQTRRDTMPLTRGRDDDDTTLKIRDPSQLPEHGDEGETTLKQRTRHSGPLSEGRGDNDTPLKEVAGDTRRLTGRGDDDTPLKTPDPGVDEGETTLKRRTRHSGQLSEARGRGDNDTPLKEVAGDTRRLSGRRGDDDTPLKTPDPGGDEDDTNLKRTAHAPGHLTEGAAEEDTSLKDVRLDTRQYSEEYHSLPSEQRTTLMATPTDPLREGGMMHKGSQGINSNEGMIGTIDCADIDLRKCARTGDETNGLLQQLRSHIAVNVIHLKLDNNNFSGQLGEELGEIVMCMTSLQSLSMCGCQLSAGGLKGLAKGLSNCPRLEKLRLSENNFSSLDAAKAVKDMITSASGLKTLSLKQCQLKGEGALDVAASLAQRTLMERLDLSGNDFQGKEAAKALVASINLMTNLQSLGLDQCNLTIDGLEKLQDCKNMRVLMLSRNKFSSPAAGNTLKTIITSMSQLEHFNVTCCHLSDEAMKTVTLSLLECKNLQKLQLEESDFCDQQTCMALMECLEAMGKRKQMTDLNLKNCKLTNHGAKGVLGNLARYSGETLLLLDLSNVDFSDLSVAQALGDSFKDMCQLETLGLKGCQLTVDGACYVAVGLSHCSHMKTLDLSGNNFSGSEAFAALLASVKTMKSLQILGLTKTKLSSEAKKELKKCLTCKIKVDK